MTTAVLTKAHSTVDIIDGAKQALLTDGWMTGDFRCDETGERCAIGALRWAAFGTEQPSGEEILTGNYLDALKAVAQTIDATALRNALNADTSEFDEDYGSCGDPDCCSPAGGIPSAEANRVYAIEEIVTSYNDARVQTLVGRNAVIRRFDRAVAKLA